MENNTDKPSFLDELAGETISDKEIEDKLRWVVLKELDNWAKEVYCNLKQEILLKARSGNFEMHNGKKIISDRFYIGSYDCFVEDAFASAVGACKSKKKYEEQGVYVLSRCSLRLNAREISEAKEIEETYYETVVLREETFFRPQLTETRMRTQKRTVETWNLSRLTQALWKRLESMAKSDNIQLAYNTASSEYRVEYRYCVEY